MHVDGGGESNERGEGSSVSHVTQGGERVNMSKGKQKHLIAERCRRQRENQAKRLHKKDYVSF